MKLPNHENAVILQAKITDYLLSETHEDGKHKAAFFLRFGFSVAQWQVLYNALLKHVADNEVASTLDTTRGRHFVVEGELTTPSGRTPWVRSVWVLEVNSDTPRFITAYPLKTKKEQDND